MGNLKVQWMSDADGIMWTWDRLPGATYDYAVVTGSDLPHRGSSNPCADAIYEQLDVPDTHAGSAAGPVALLCVRTNNPDDDVASGSNEVIPVIVSLCIQARYEAGGVELLGPWTVSPAETVEKQRQPSQ